MRYRLQSISTLSIARFGCLLGWIVTIVPTLACGVFFWGILAVLRNWLAGLERIRLDLLGFETSIDLIELLQLQEFLTLLETLAGRALPLLLALVIAVAVLGGLLVALTLILLGWGYNLVAWLTGGLELELREIAGHVVPSTDDKKAIRTPPMENDEA